MPSRNFKYNWRIYAMVYVVLLIAPLTVWIIMAAFIQKFVIFGIWLILFMIIIIATFLKVHLRFSKICVDDNGISAWKFSCCWKRVEWAKLRKITKVIEFDQPSNAPRTFVYLIDLPKSQNFHIRRLLSNTKWGALMFEDRIVGLEELLQIVNQKAKTYSVNIFSVDHMADSRAGRTLWRKLEPIEHETRISQL